MSVQAHAGPETPAHPERFVFVQTFGCQMNVYDTQRIYQVLSPLGYAVTSDPARANLILLNTCSVRDKAEQKMVSALGRYARLKEFNEDLVLGVSGCVAQQEGARLLDKVPHLDLVFGPDNIPALPDLLDRVRTSQDRVAETTFFKRKDYAFIEAEPMGEARVSEFVTVMKGCDKVCSFCIVPFTRGREISKPVEMVVDEVRRLVDRGTKEVMLLGQNVNSYGKDRAQQPHFAELLRSVDAIEGLERLRFTTSHPMDCTDGLIDCFGTLPSLCEYFHLPVQSGSERILASMRRKQTIGDYLDRAERLKSRHPDMALSTDIIVGYPTETEADFEATVALLERVQYDSIFAFKYSPRPGTRAAEMPDDVPEQAKKERLNELLRVQREITAKRMQRFSGRAVEVLIEGPSRDSARGRSTEWQLSGRTRSNVVVNAPAPRGDLWDRRWVGQLAQVEVSKVLPHSLYGHFA